MNRLGNVLIKLNSASKCLSAQSFHATKCQVASTFSTCRLKSNPAPRYSSENGILARFAVALNYKAIRFASDKRAGEIKVKDQFENIVTIPNILTVSRMAMCPVLGYLVVQNNYTTAFGLFVAAGITDLLDGWIARKFPSQSSLAGSFLDPMADKLLIGTLFISLTYSGLIPLPLTALIVLRDVLLILAGFYIRYISLPPPKTLNRYFDASLASAQLAPTGISKVNTAVQLLLVASSLAVPAFSLNESLLPFMWYVTGTTTVLSGLSYVFAKNTYRIITRSRAK